MLHKVTTRMTEDLEAGAAAAAWRPTPIACVESIVQIFEQPSVVEKNHDLAITPTIS